MCGGAGKRRADKTVSGPLQRIGYGASQSARVAWYVGHYLALNRIRGPLNRPGEAPFKPQGRVPDLRLLLRGIRELFEQDWRHIAEGAYLPPDDGAADPAAFVRRSLAF